MIRIIFKKELKEIFRTSKISWMIGGLLILTILSVYNGYTYYKNHSRLLKESQEVTYQQFISQGNKNPHLGAHFGFYAYKPTADLAMIDNGIEDYTGNSFYLEPHKRGIIKFREVTDATSLKSFGFFNIAYLVQFIFPLFVFLICHNIFSKEWENGTIKMLLSSKAGKLQLYMGKLLACLSVVFMIIGIIVLAAFGLLLTGTGHFGAVLPSFLIFVVGLCLFAIIMTSIAVSVSLLTRSATLSLVILSGFWLTGVFLTPRLSAEVSKQTFPSITSIEFEHRTFNEMQYGVKGEGTKDQRREQLLKRTLAAYHVDSIQRLPVFFIPITIEFFEESDGKVMDRAYSAVEQNQARQDGLVRSLAIFSPFLAFRDFSMHMTATDMNTHNDFAEKAEIHRRKVGVIVDDFYQDHVEASNDFWKTVPQFKYEPPGTGMRFLAAWSAMAVLVCWGVLTIGLMIFSYRKMSV
ncbi:ABC transporter permease subunit [Chitinophaga sp. LS1]|uniref:ABC transporter permease subunit n=1 Tax=Chitinophaga sp. LS1 TaxID=3051176 RepID=UPI002AAA7921|nr:ABC transporter permease subunit [Chitinophaga sp. LS1]WPV63777.1 ABC transporter permease subunit [Chitinophaga sp. LS1]